MFIRFEDVCKTYNVKKLQVDACIDINFSVEKGDIFGVVGYSGAGKSTLIRMINALEKPTAGRVIVNGGVVSELSGAELRKARKNISMIFQNFNLLHNKTVYENVRMPLLINNTPKNEIKSKVDEILRFVGLADKTDVYPSNLSGGQKQRVGIARALTTNPEVLLCDEPTSALDPKTTESILGLLRQVNREMNITIVIITHHMGVVQKLCNKVAVMEAGRIVEIGKVQEIFTRPQQEITKTFVNTVIDDRIPQVLADKLKAAPPGKILRVRCLDGNVCDTFVPELRAKFAAGIETLFFSVNELQGALLTIFCLRFTGTPEEIETAEKYLYSRYECEEVIL